MPIVATEKFGVWWNYQVHELAAGDIVPDGEFATHLLTTGVPVVVQDGDTPDVDGDGVPDGTAAQILDWVGTDTGRAAAALEAEQRREPPRVTLTTALAKIVNTVPPVVSSPDPVEPPAPPAEPGTGE